MSFTLDCKVVKAAGEAVAKDRLDSGTVKINVRDIPTKKPESGLGSAVADSFWHRHLSHGCHFTSLYIESL